METTTTPVDEPPRPDLASTLPDRPRWLPTVVVFLVMVGTVLGGFVVAAALSGPPPPPVEVGGVVRVQPLSGWEAASTTRSGELPFSRLTRGSGTLDVMTVPGFVGDAESLAERYATDVLTRQLTGLSISKRPRPVLVAGRPGERFDYVGVNDAGAPIEGEVTVLLTVGGDGVVFDGWAGEGLLSFVEGDIHTMEDEAVLL